MLEGWKALLGQAADDPEQLSCTSHAPADVRQTVLEGAKPSAGQVVAEPLQDSATSQPPLAARQTTPLAAGLQVPTEPALLQTWQSLLEPPPQVELQQTPSTQLPLEHWLPVEQLAPLARLQAGQGPPQSMPVSPWFFVPSLHDAGWHFAEVQTPLSQSEPAAQIPKSGHAVHASPPQSTSVSVPFFVASRQVAAVQTPSSAQIWLLQSAPAAQG